MSRTIKFRAWMPKEHKWYKGGAIQLTAILGNEFGLSEANGKIIQLSQSTGLPDKRGNDIYEGDIVTMEPHQLPFETRWYGGNFHFVEPHSRTTYYVGAPSGLPTIIGNIYENPELLDQLNDLVATNPDTTTGTQESAQSKQS